MTSESVGPYRIVGRLGRGGMGEVFLADDTRLKRRVALKSVTEDWAIRPDAQRRLLREAQAAAALNHPNIAGIYDVLETDQGAYIVMEYVGEETLAERLRAGPLEPNAAARLGAQLCEALSEAHAHGIVHRDVKPRNLALTPEGRLKVLDFGLAKSLVLGPGVPNGSSSEEAAERPERVVGTLPYVSPEHLLGRPVDQRSDIYSAGVVLYELLAGRRPFSGATSAALCTAILEGKPPRPRELNPSVPEQLERVALKAMARDPRERYLSASAMKADLLRCADATDGEVTESFDDWTPLRRRRRLLAVLAAIAAFGGVLLGVGSWPQIVAFVTGRAPGAGIEALAVVPFENATGDPGWADLAQGITDDLARQLQRLGVPVKSRLAARRLGGLTDGEIAERLGVDRVARGRLSLQDGDVLLDTWLTWARSGAEIWRRGYRQPRDRAGGLHLLVASDLAAAAGHPGSGALAAPPAGDRSFRAYEAYHKGRVYWEQRTREGLLKSIDYFELATNLDPRYAQAWAGMADAYLGLGVPTFGAFQPQEMRRIANEAALRALDLDPQLAEVHTSLAYASYAYDWNWAAAAERFRKAIDLDPQYATAHHWYADYLLSMGRPQEAMREIERAFELEPLSILIHRDFGWHYFFQRRYANAVAQLRQTLRIDPRYVAARSLLGRALVEAGEPALGLAELEKAAPDLPRGAALAFLAYARAAAGETEKAQATLDELLRLRGPDYVSPYYVALVYVRLGRKSEALQWLEKGFEDHDTTMSTLMVDPRLDPLRGEPRYQAIVRKMNFPREATDKTGGREWQFSRERVADQPRTLTGSSKPKADR